VYYPIFQAFNDAVLSDKMQMYKCLLYIFGSLGFRIVYWL